MTSQCPIVPHSTDSQTAVDSHGLTNGTCLSILENQSPCRSGRFVKQTHLSLSNGQPLEEVKNLTISRDLSWADHIAKLPSEVS